MMATTTPSGGASNGAATPGAPAAGGSAAAPGGALPTPIPSSGGPAAAGSSGGSEGVASSSPMPEATVPLEPAPPGVGDTPAPEPAGMGGNPGDPVDVMPGTAGMSGMDAAGGMPQTPEPEGAGGSDVGAGGTPAEQPDEGGGDPLDPEVQTFSFFVVSMAALQELSGSPDGFGGDLRFGQPTGLEGADEICRQAAEMGLPGAGQKEWRAFLSVTSGPDGTPVNARDRIGTGPWYDVQGRLVSEDLDGLFSGDRPAGDPSIIEDLPNERGEPNHYVGPTGLDTMTYDNHDTITGSDTQGMLASMDAADTCEDWTSTSGGRPMCGHSWPRNANSGRQWASDHAVPGCAPGLDRTLGGSGDGSCIGCSGGYGGFYCFSTSSGSN